MVFFEGQVRNQRCSVLSVKYAFYCVLHCSFIIGMEIKHLYSVHIQAATISKDFSSNTYFCEKQYIFFRICRVSACHKMQYKPVFETLIKTRGALFATLCHLMKNIVFGYLRSGTTTTEVNLSITSTDEKE